MTRPRPWTWQEAAILLDGYLRHIQKGVSKAKIIEDVSSTLRALAIARGETIDDIFRNTNGITFQLASMESAYQGHTIMKPATQLFSEIVNLYRNDPDQYETLLTEALAMATAKKEPSQADYMSWLARKTTSSKLTEYRSLYIEINKLFNRAKKTSYNNLFEDISVTKVRTAIEVIDSDTWFRYFHPKKYNAAKEALAHILLYLQDFEESNIPVDNTSRNEAPQVAEPKREVPSPAMSSLLSEVPPVSDEPEQPSSGPQNEQPESDTVEEKQEAPALADPTKPDPIAVSASSEVNSSPTAIDADAPKAYSSDEEAPESKPEKSLSNEELVEAVLRKECEKSTYGTTVSYIQWKLRDLRPREVKAILTAAPWAKYEYGVWKYVPLTPDEPASAPQDVEQLEVPVQPTATKQPEPESSLDRDSSMESRYPILYKRLRLALENAAKGGGHGLSANQLYDLTGKISRISIIQEILAQVSWARLENGIYSFTEEQSPEKKRKTATLHFDAPTKLTLAEPVKLTYFHTEIAGACSWQDLYVAFFEALYEDYPHRFRPGMRFSKKKGGLVDLGDHDMYLKMWSPRLLKSANERLILETKYNADQIVERMRFLLDWCRVDYENVELTYSVPDDEPVSKPVTATPPAGKKNSQEAGKAPSKESVAAKSDDVKMLHTPEDAALMQANPDAFPAVFQALRNRTYGKNLLCGATAICKDLNEVYPLETVSAILNGASWSKKSGVRFYAFVDPAQEKQHVIFAQEKERSEREAFFKWLPSYLSAPKAKELEREADSLIQPLLDEKLLKQTLFLTLTITQVEGAAVRARGLFVPSQTLEDTLILFGAYAAYLREKKHLPAKKASDASNHFKPESNWLKYNFSNAGMFRGTIPVYCSINGEQFTTKTWVSLLAAIVNKEIEEENAAIERLFHHSLQASKDDKPFLLRRRDPGSYCVQLKAGFSMRVKSTIPQQLEMIKEFCLQCGYTQDQILIYGARIDAMDQKENAPSPMPASIPQPSVEKRPAPPVKPAPKKREAQPIKPPAHYQEVLTEKFPRGFRIGSGLDMKKFRRYYEEKVGSALDGTDKEIEDGIRLCGIQYESKLFVPEAMLPQELRNELFSFIRNNLSDGKPALYYEAIFKEFSERFLDHYVYSAEMLKSYIAYYNKGEFYLGNQYLAKDASVELDPYDEVKHYLITAKMPVESDKICSALSHIPQSKVMQILGSNLEFVNNGVLVNNGSSSYCHVDVVQLSKEDLSNIKKIIEEAISEHDFLSGNELIASIRAKYPHIIDNNAQITPLGMRGAIKYRLQRSFSFAGNVISARNRPLSMADVYSSFAKSHSSFSMDELTQLSSDMGSTIYFDSVYENAIRIDEKRFVSKENAHFQIEETDSVLDSFCVGDFIPFQEINSFSFFPESGYPWSTFLLESYVYSFSQKYRLLHSNFSRKSSAGAIVKRSSGIDNFDSLLAHALAASDTAITADAAISFFVKRGYLVRRNYANIESVLLQAKTIRNTKGT